VSNYLATLVRRGAGLGAQSPLRPVIAPDSLPITGLSLHDAAEAPPETQDEFVPVAPRVASSSPQMSSAPHPAAAPLAYVPGPQPLQRTMPQDVPSRVEKQVPPAPTPALMPAPPPTLMPASPLPPALPQWQAEATGRVSVEMISSSPPAASTSVPAHTLPPASPPAVSAHSVPSTRIQPREEATFWPAALHEQPTPTPPAPAVPAPALRDVRATHAASPPDVRVRIGRVEIRVHQPPTPLAAVPPVTPRGFADLTLARTYLDRRWS
jgi:hypothetical protein